MSDTANQYRRVMDSFTSAASVHVRIGPAVQPTLVQDWDAMNEATADEFSSLACGRDGSGEKPIGARSSAGEERCASAAPVSQSESIGVRFRR
jgi:hypothetical protein